MTKVLLVEDDLLISRMYQKIFMFEGIDVVMAANGKEGLAAIVKDRPDLILLDVMMPVMNGLQTLEYLKTHDETKSIPVVMLTNLAGEDDAEQAIKKGAMKYVVKSEHSPKEIADMVKDMLAAAGAKK